jgi:aspartate/methionine/tyrosine aminotransferase
LADVALAIGCAVTRWEAREHDGWRLDPDDLRRSIRSNTRAIVINTPHNPTGYLMAKDVFRQVSDIAQEHGIILFSDEVYRESEHNEADRLPAACDLGAAAVSLGVMSKTYGLPGLRIGWIATRNAKVYARMAELRDYTTICNSAPSEFLAELALRHRDVLARRNLGIIRRNLELLDQFFDRHEDLFVWRRPKAGPIAFPRLLRGDVDSFCHALAEKAGVMLLPGTVYDDIGSHFRVGFGREGLAEALDQMEKFMRSMQVA